MGELTYTFDDFEAARKFVLSLKTKIIKQRFTSLQDWKPDHCALAYIDGVPVALADCNVSADKKGAICGLIAHPKFGGYAVHVLSALKRHTELPRWVAAIRAPNASVLAISRRYLDELYDQTTWEISNELMLQYGQKHYLSPIPLLLSQTMFRNLGLPAVNQWDDRTKWQVLNAARAPGSVNLIAPSGDSIGPLLMTFAFELANTPVSTRQHMTRTMMFTMLGMHGHTPPMHLIRKFLSPSAIADFLKSVDAAMVALRPDDGEALFQSKAILGGVPRQA